MRRFFITTECFQIYCANLSWLQLVDQNCDDVSFHLPIFILSILSLHNLTDGSATKFSSWHLTWSLSFRFFPELKVGGKRKAFFQQGFRHLSSFSCSPLLDPSCFLFWSFLFSFSHWYHFPLKLVEPLRCHLLHGLVVSLKRGGHPHRFLQLRVLYLWA